MNRWMRNHIANLCNTASATVTAIRNALTQRLQSLCETASLLYNRMMENMGYGEDSLKNIV